MLYRVSHGIDCFFSAASIANVNILEIIKLFSTLYNPFGSIILFS